MLHHGQPTSARGRGTGRSPPRWQHCGGTPEDSHWKKSKRKPWLFSPHGSSSKSRQPLLSTGHTWPGRRGGAHARISAVSLQGLQLTLCSFHMAIKIPNSLPCFFNEMQRVNARLKHSPSWISSFPRAVLKIHWGVSIPPGKGIQRLLQPMNRRIIPTRYPVSRTQAHRRHVLMARRMASPSVPRVWRRAE